MSRFVKIPPPPESLPQLLFDLWFCWYVDAEKRLRLGPPSAGRAARRMLEALDAAVDGVIELRDEDQALLAQLLLTEDEPPECGYSPAFTITPQGGESFTRETPTRLVVPFLDAIALATFERPAPAPAQAAE